jgi:hydrogenase nickel incorporation protein HypA/HybF
LEATVHELGITQGIVDRARQAALDGGGVRIAGVYITMTPAADFTQDSIEMYFEMLTADDDFFRGAQLSFNRGSAAATCLACGCEFETAEGRPACPRCSSNQVRWDPRAAMVQLTGVDIVEEGDSETP